MFSHTVFAEKERSAVLSAGSALRTLLVLFLAAALLLPVLLVPVSAEQERKTVPTPTPSPAEDDVASYTDDELIELALEAEKNCRNYSTVSNKKVALELPFPEEHLDEALSMEVKFSGNGAIFIMPRPQAGNGALDTVKAGTKVTVIAEYKGFYFFVCEEGRMGWNGKDYFVEASPASVSTSRTSVSQSRPDDDYLLWSDDELIALALEAEENCRNYSTVSNKKVALELPYPEDYLDEALDREVKFSGNGAIFIMPRPQAGNGALDTVKAGTEVTVIAEYKGFYFFICEDGRMGWNGKDFFTE